ncbi:MAG: hypothetical protein HZB18_03935 [Chloroflexi bacterium]|nr:hypothetical protein [Chloroflexota bacterium]
MIDEYVRATEEAVASLGNLTRGSMIYKEEREADFIVLRGEVKFVDGSQLHFREFVQLKQGQLPHCYKYAYHYQRADETVIFRYDNARHYLDLSTAPHHKHIGENEVVAANAPDLESVLKEIEGMVKT